MLINNPLVRTRQYMDVNVGTDKVTLRRPEHGQYVVLTVNGKAYEVGHIASAFPLSAPLDLIVFFDRAGQEIALMKNARSLDDESRRVLKKELEKGYFMPRIDSINNVEETLGVATWTVTTNKGRRTFDVRDPRTTIRTMGEGRVIIKDVDGNRYEIRDWYRLDRKSMSFLTQHL